MRTEYIETDWGYEIPIITQPDLIQCKWCKDSILFEAHLGHQVLCKERVHA